MPQARNEFVRQQRLRFASIVLSSVLEPDLTIVNIPVYCHARFRRCATWTSFSPRLTRCTISILSFLSGREFCR